ncbi:anthranilate phosphoribosyltransferase [Thermanaerovibrio velox DSM 12556]|uniref:Anthranilate phosphoribosyltransferase n=1 Tax=Thermanaerovibrio velox DSM 12556 TaxID=926567 RepID=H0UP95_9BACT|nr:anthranilate phosphoribosyltransferase [Thermanaerovibrio velox]EHM09508.1 anthranilate phosphoribosyltransferase [Thermanaerovibrio velox DSM 12556]
MLKEQLEKILSGKNLAPQEMADAMESILSGGEPDALVGAFLAGLRAKGETVEEIASAASVIRSKVVPVNLKGKTLIDIVGTGGDRAGTINISTGASFIAAAAGSLVAKHGNRSVSSRCGSADILEALGIPLLDKPEDVKACISKTGYGFIFAPHFNSPMKNVAPIRKAIGLRTIFNILGPLSNPAKPSHQLVGVFSPKLVRPITEVLALLGVSRAMVFHGHGGLDELSLSGPNRVCLLNRGKIQDMEILPEDAGLSRAPLGYASGGGVNENRRILLDIFGGMRGPMRDVVVLNAAAALYVDGLTTGIFEGARMAEQIIDSGLAMKKLEEVVRFSRSITGKEEAV